MRYLDFESLTKEELYYESYGILYVAAMPHHECCHCS